jgi:hypothetical protein
MICVSAYLSLKYTISCLNTSGKEFMESLTISVDRRHIGELQTKICKNKK